MVLAVGALEGRDLDVPGRELEGIHVAMDYLGQQNRRVAGLPVEEEEITAEGQERHHPRRRRHERRLPRQRPTARVRSLSRVLTHGPPATGRARPGGVARGAVRPERLRGPRRRRRAEVERRRPSASPGRTVTSRRYASLRPSGRKRAKPSTKKTPSSSWTRTSCCSPSVLPARCATGCSTTLNLEFGNRGAIAAPEGYATGVPNVFVAGDAKLGARPHRYGHRRGPQGRPARGPASYGPEFAAGGRADQYFSLSAVS